MEFTKLKKYTVLVVEDDDVDREKILRLLKKSDLPLTIFEGSSATEALTMLENEEFNCAILDYHLPDALGSDLISAISKHKKNPTPIIMISGNSDERVIANVMRDGVFDYLPKRDLESAQLKKSLEASFHWADNERQINEINNRFSQLAEGLPQLVWACTADGECDFLNKRWIDFTGMPAEQQYGKSWIKQIHPDDQFLFLQAWKKSLATGEEMCINIRLRKHDGEYRWFDTRATPQRDTVNNIIRWFGSNTDITEIELTRQALLHSEKRFHAAFDYAPVGMTIIDADCSILQINSALMLLLGHTSDDNEQLKNSTINIFFDAEHLNVMLHKLKSLKQDSLPNIQFESKLRSKTGEFIPILISAAILNTTVSNFCFLCQIYDLSERKRYETELIKLAQTDSLTGLGNRATIFDEVDKAITKFHRTGTTFALLFGDLDNFKQINDSLGHEAGDQLLLVIARRLKQNIRKEDIVARLGGDEFVILFQDTNNYESVITATDKLIAQINQPIRLGMVTIHIGMSFGITLFPVDGEDAKTLLRNADSALYDAKAKGRGQYQLYRKELTEFIHNRLQLDADLRHAIEKQEFEVYFQPVIDLKNHEVVSAEALIRWHHPTRGMVAPDEFIGYAQESGLIVKIDEWVINKAIQQISQWHTIGHNINVSINVSARQFQNNKLIATVENALQQHKVAAEFLTIEITEQMFLENTEANLNQIVQLKALGVKLSLDDFGIGFSSLSYIIRFSPHYLKIDRSFVAKIGEATEHDEMVRAIIGLSNIIPMKIIGEGIETERQQKFLTTLGCHYGQGYLFSKPVSADSLLLYLVSTNAKNAKRQV